MNVEKMRRRAECLAAASAEADHARWLASLTPQHRAIHQRPYGSVCMECISANVLAATEALAAATARLKTAQGRR